MEFTEGSGRTRVRLQLTAAGEDWQVLLTGGERPHIGAVVLAVPRPSLRGSGMSCDCWVTPVTAHKDHLMAQPLAEKLCLACGRTVAVSAGLHVDRAAPEELRQFERNCRAAADAAVEWLQGQAAD